MADPTRVTLLWGQEPDPGDEAQTYRFYTSAERAAFLLGVKEALGWQNAREAPEGYVVTLPEDRTEDDDQIYMDRMI